MSKSLSSLFTKERLWTNPCCCSLQNSVRERIALNFFKKERRQWFTRDLSKLHSKNEQTFFICIQFLVCFGQFSPLFMPKEWIAPAPVAIRSVAFLKKINGINLVALYKRATMSKLIPSIFKKRNGSDSLFFRIELLFRSFDHKKRVIRSKNQWSNSQPCY